MKKLFLLPLLFFFVAASAQKEVSASEIFKMIDDGQTVNIENATIRGKLDLTELKNQEVKSKNKDNREYKSYVKAPIRFVNCVFNGDVIAYKNLQDSDQKKTKNVTITWNENSETYSTNFEEAVTFEKCTFNGKSEFKYSTFSEAVNFEGTSFAAEANFKYAKFKEMTGFGNCSFKEEANFKYAEFSQDADFFNNTFRNYANFKYAKFGNRVTFKKSDFGSEADFKYTKISKEAIFTDARFSNTPDFKYTSGKRFMD